MSLSFHKRLSGQELSLIISWFPQHNDKSGWWDGAVSEAWCRVDLETRSLICIRLNNNRSSPAEIFQLRRLVKQSEKKTGKCSFRLVLLHIPLEFIKNTAKYKFTYIHAQPVGFLWNQHNAWLRCMKITQRWVRISIDYEVMTIDSDQIDETSHLVVNASPEDSNRMAAGNIKVYRRRWYILFLFTLLNTTGNILWNTWPPIQETCQLVFGWDKTNVLIIGALQAVGSIISIVPSAWLLDTKGEWNV